MAGEDDTDISVRKCRELFEALEEVGGSEQSAAALWKDAFFFAFDGHNPPIIPDSSVSEFAGWLNGAIKIVTALKNGGYFKS